MSRYHSTLTNAELKAQLKRQGLPVHEQEQLLSDAQIARKQRLADAAFIRLHRDAWRAVLTPLRQEWNNARTSAAYDPSDALRVEAFETYADVLEHTRLRLLGRMLMVREIPMTFNEFAGNTTGMQEKELNDLFGAFSAAPPVKHRPFTPSELAKHMTKRHEETGKGFPVPNYGVHWSDWVSPAQRLQVEALFEALATRADRKKRAKVKEPFKRIDPKDKFDTKREALLATAEKEVERLTSLYEVAMQGHAHRVAAIEDMGRTYKDNPKDLHARLGKRLAKAKKAVHLLQRMTRDDGALPNTWHGVLKKD